MLHVPAALLMLRVPAALLMLHVPAALLLTVGGEVECILFAATLPRSVLLVLLTRLVGVEPGPHPFLAARKLLGHFYELLA